MEFEKRKAFALQEMASSAADKSPKGTIDAPIIPLLNILNQHPSYFTTSSCSGRISILSQPRDPQQKTKKKKKAGGGSWLFMTHDPADPESVVHILFRSNAPSSIHESLVFRFEPFILAVECKDVSSAQILVSSAVSCGFRESGITSIHKRIMVAIRCSIRLEVPLGERDCLMVTPEYVRYLIGIANEKMVANRRRTDGFLQVLHGTVPSASRAVKSDNDHKLQGFLTNQESLLTLEAKHTDILSKEMLVEENLTYTEVQNSYSLCDIYTNGIDDPVPESTRLCTEGTSGCTNSAKEILHSNQSTNGSLNLERTDSDSEVSISLEQCRISLVKMMISGEPVEKLFLWGHSACSLSYLHQKKILVFGGFGGSGRHARRNDSLMLDSVSGILKVINVDESPSPRMGHSLSVVGELIFVIGGRGGPTQIMNDVWVLHTDENQWKFLECAGSLFHPRHRHAAAVVGSKLYVFGGLNNNMIYSCLHVLDTQNAQWSEVRIQGEWPCARHSHSMVAHGLQLFMFGGYDGEKALGDLYSFDAGTGLWKNEKTIGRTYARFSHSMFVYDHYLGIFGGCPIKKQFQEVALLDLRNRAWKHVSIYSVSRDLFVRSTTCVVDDDLFVVGGGASCYAFGTKFNEPMKLNLRLLVFSVGIPCRMEDKSTIKEVKENHDIFFSTTDNSMYVTNDKMLLYDNNAKTAFDGEKPLVLQLDKKSAKLGKDLLKKIGWLDLGRKVHPSEDGLHICLPITEDSYPFLQERVLDSVEVFYHSNGFNSAAREKSVSVNGSSFKMELNHLLASGGSVCIDNTVSVRKALRAPQKLLREAVCSLIQQKGFPLLLLEQLPTRWERLGNIVVLPVACFKDTLWETIGVELWPIVAKSLGAKRLARQGRVLPNGTRDSTMEILLGDNGWVDHNENGIIYSFDSTKCMFSFGNLSEKLRMARLDCVDEIVVDLFAGIGYFVLPFLVKAKAKLVYACEWNPHAIEALRHNIQVNSVSDRCIILQGDNRVTAPKGVADRVCLGLLPTSECSWVTAVRALRTRGGVMHVHGNVKDLEEDSWSQYVVKSIDSISKSEGYCWDVSLQHLERVKWYGPHIRHIVVDIRCKLLQV